MSNTCARRVRGVSLSICLAVLAACGSSKQATPATTTAAPTTTAATTSATTTAVAPTTTAAFAFPVTVKAANGDVVIASAPKAIVSLSPTATEMLFAVGAGSQVIAVDDQSTYPPTAPKTDLSGFKPNIEAIVAKKPDLVVIADDSAKLSDALAKLNIKVLVEPPATTLDDTYKQIAELGTTTGHADQAGTVATKIRNDLADLVAKAPKTSQRVYHELDNTLYSASSSSFVGQIYTLFGMQNIADAADKDKTGYPQLSPEYVAQSNPQIIFLADTRCCQQDAAAVAARPGWAGIDAVTKGKVVALDDDVASRWGPRVVDLARTIASTLGA
jgi:iron complex transport system substrate-binding protein